MNRTLLIAALAVATLSSTSAFAKSAEISNPNGELLVGSAPSNIVTPVANGYACMADYTSKLTTHPVFSVGKITDQTGKFSNEASAGGFEVTQGLSNEVYSALGELPGIRIAERSDMAIVDNDLTLFKQHLIGDPNEPGYYNPQGVLVGKGLRDYKAGQMLGVDYFITGAITGINYNIWSGGAQIGVNNIGPGHRVYAMLIEMDLRVVDARTLEVIKPIKVRKTIRGYETTLGVFSFFNGANLFDINAGKKAQEPVELGVRSAMESGLLELVGATVPTATGKNYGKVCSDYAEATYGQVTGKTVPATVTAQK